jgi:hypothetical protein
MRILSLLMYCTRVFQVAQQVGACQVAPQTFIAVPQANGQPLALSSPTIALENRCMRLVESGKLWLAATSSAGSSSLVRSDILRDSAAILR